VGLDFLILGPLEVREGARRIVLGGSRQRSVLALLLLSRGEVLSIDRLIDQLWGEAPPRTAATAVHGYVSQLRKALTNGSPRGRSVIVTREPGYVLAIEPEQLDLARFEGLRASAREASARGEPAVALAELERALGLWRGSTLEDLADESFALEAARRIEELRMGAVEERFDAALALGKGRELVPEIESAIGREPLREHLREQLMLALYRAGRQADALRAYDDARHTLVAELGIEPGSSLRRLHQQMLEQAPELEAVPNGTQTAGPASATGAGTGGRYSHWLGLTAGLAALAVVSIALLLVLLLAGSSGKLAVRGDSVAVIFPAGGRVAASFPIGGTPTAVAVGVGAAWVLNADDETVTRIDLGTRAQQTFGTAGIPVGLATGDGSLWIANGTRISGAGSSLAALPSTVVRLDPNSLAVLATIALSTPRGRTVGESEYNIAVGPDGVWVIDPDGSVSRIDPATDHVVQTFPDLSATALASGAEGTWVLESDGTVAELGTGSDRAVQSVPAPGGALTSIAVGGGAVWATDPSYGTLWRIDPSLGRLTQSIPLAAGANDVTYGAGSVWVSNGLSGTVTQLDPTASRVRTVIPVGNAPGRLVVGGGRVWVAVAGAPGESVAAAAPGRARIASLPPSVCGPVMFGSGGAPQYLVVSDLPLRGAPTLPTRQMWAAIAYVLRQHGYRAGRFRLGYQSCDDSTAQTGDFSGLKCTANARAWTANPLVVGVIGPYNSQCAVDELPVTNTADLAMISPTNTDIELTHLGPVSSGTLPTLYPTGRRNYARVIAPDDRQAAAMADFAAGLRLSRIYVLDDYSLEAGAPMAASFQIAARHLNIQIAGVDSWKPDARNYTALAEVVARSRADGVYVSGLLADGSGAVIRTLRELLGSRVTILANDGSLPIAQLFQRAKSAARGVYVSTPFLPTAELPSKGRAFVAGFAATQHQAPVDPAAVNAAQATEILLDAIARSNGTRQSISRAMLTSCQRNGILGSVCIDPNGDPRTTSIAIVVAQRPAGSRTAESIDGATVVAVISPPAALIR
jgi:DNA-binding SARP family transcriptional activator/ABC-type branched-subunit amino acid transport system substrate-binding protein